MALISGMVGFFILLFGRQFYLFFVGGVFLLFGLHTGENLSFVNSQESLIIYALFLGLAAALATIKLKRAAAAAAGFLGGGALLLWLPPIFGWSTGWFSWTLFIVVGLISALLVLFLLDYYLILLSVILGAVLIAQNVPLSQFSAGAVFLLTALIGLLTQLILLQYGSGYPD